MFRLLTAIWTGLHKGTMWFRPEDVGGFIDHYRRPISGPGANRIILEIRTLVAYFAFTVVDVASPMFVRPSKLRATTQQSVEMTQTGLQARL